MEYPPKPLLQKKNSNKWLKSIVSLAIFLITFELLFDYNIINIIILLAIILIHELGHFIAMKYYKYEDVGILFIPLFGAATTGIKKQIIQTQKAVVILAGPLPGLVLGFILFGLGKGLNNDLFTNISYLFLFFNVLNLLPFKPLDGGQLVETIFLSSKINIQIIIAIISTIGLTLMGIYLKWFLIFFIIPGIWSFIISTKNLNKLRMELIGKGFKLNVNYEELEDKDYWLIRDELLKQAKQVGTYIKPGKYKEVEDEKLKIKQISNILFKDPIKDLKQEDKINLILLWIVALVFPLMILLYNQ